MHDPRLIGAVHREHAVRPGNRTRRELPDWSDRQPEIEPRRGFGERSFERVELDIVRKLDDEHHCELAREDRHRRVLEVGTELQQRSGDCGGDTRTIRAERPDDAALHAQPSSCNRCSDIPK